MEFFYEYFYKESSLVSNYLQEISEDGSQEVFTIVKAKETFLYFLFEILEKCGLLPRWYDEETLAFENKLEFEGQDIKESIGYNCLEEAKERFNSFFGEGEEREKKIAMFLLNEKLFRNIYGVYI